MLTGLDSCGGRQLRWHVVIRAPLCPYLRVAAHADADAGVRAKEDGHRDQTREGPRAGALQIGEVDECVVHTTGERREVFEVPIGGRILTWHAHPSRVPEELQGTDARGGEPSDVRDDVWPREWADDVVL